MWALAHFGMLTWFVVRKCVCFKVTMSKLRSQFSWYREVQCMEGRHSTQKYLRGVASPPIHPWRRRADINTTYATSPGMDVGTTSIWRRLLIDIAPHRARRRTMTSGRPRSPTPPSAHFSDAWDRGRLWLGVTNRFYIFMSVHGRQLPASQAWDLHSHSRLSCSETHWLLSSPPLGVVEWSGNVSRAGRKSSERERGGELGL